MATFFPNADNDHTTLREYGHIPLWAQRAPPYLNIAVAMVGVVRIAGFCDCVNILNVTDATACVTFVSASIHYIHKICNVYIYTQALCGKKVSSWNSYLYYF